MRRKRYPQLNSLILLLFLCFPLIGNFLFTTTISLEISSLDFETYKEATGLSNQNDFPSSVPSDLLTIKSPLSISNSDINESFEVRLNLTNPLMNPNIKGTNITIAILDSGINDTNWIGENVIIDRLNVTQSNVSAYDNIGHGSLVGSIISKIAPEARLLSIKVTDKTGTATKEAIETGINLALTHNVSIIHASFGSSDIYAFNSSLISSMIDRNISFIVSAGNSGPFGSSITSPAIFNEAIAVGMTYNETYLPISSSVGPRPTGSVGPDLVAPGVYIPSYVNADESQNVSGTSFASPFVTGAVALLRQAFPKITPMTIKTALLSSASFIDGVSPTQQGNGLLNMTKTFSALENINETPLLTFTPREISSDFYYFGQAINGQDQTYNLGVYSSLNVNLTRMNISTLKPILAEIPQNNSSNLAIPIDVGFNLIKLSVLIPKTLPMNEWEGTIEFDFKFNKTNSWTNKTDNYLIQRGLPIHIENRYPGGRILFYQGYDNDSYIPDGPTGTFSKLHFYLEDLYGMQVTGAIRSNAGLSISGPIQVTTSSQGHVSEEDLANYDTLVLADIEMGLTTEDISVIHTWVDEGHSLLVLSYPSFKFGQTELLSNQTAINALLNHYDLSIEDDPSTPIMSRFSQASLALSSPIDPSNEYSFDYNGTSIGVATGGHAGILATATNVLDNSEDIPIAGFWHNPDTNGKVVVFGGLEPFTDINFFSPNLQGNFFIASQTFRWLIKDQEIPMKLTLSSNPSVQTSTKIQITFPNTEPSGNFNGTIVEEDGAYTQILFKYSINTFVGTWKPNIMGNAVLWLNIHLEGYAPTNGIFILSVSDTAAQQLFFYIFLGIFVVFGVVYFWVSSRRTKPRLTLQEQLSMQYKKPSTQIGTKTLEPREICSRCRTPRHNNNSTYCFKCGKEL
ncbi:MAG: S8 family peptidase [Candidatus Hodarchaeales archaeon]|jgi:hypothetical protein